MEQEIYKRIGYRIKTAREQLGISQADLSQKLDYNSAATISHFESGLRKISIEDLIRLGQVLQVPMDYFYSVEGEVNRPRVRFRAAEVRPSVRSEVSAFLAFAQSHSQAPIALSSLTGETTPWYAAEELLKIAKLQNPPVSPEEVASKLNIPVFEWGFPDEISGLFVADQGKACIGVNQSHPKVRQRFTVAHELGHFVFSDGQDLFVDFMDNSMDLQNEQKRSAEKKANIFAADLLMPKTMLKRDFKELGIDGLILLAQKYQVSEQAMWFRLINLKLVQED
jgi:Zn-dependent peptidase ImmA (M78 family)/transcriptional regulator with XRE-family HTH domain